MAMLYMTVTVLTLVVSVGALVRGLRQDVTLRQIRPTARELSAEVVGNTATRSGRAGAYFLTPVVRYHLDGRRYEARITNADFTRAAAVGSSMTILVSPESPYSPMDPYGGLGSTLRGALVTAVLCVLLLVWQIALL